MGPELSEISSGFWSSLGWCHWVTRIPRCCDSCLVSLAHIACVSSQWADVSRSRHPLSPYLPHHFWQWQWQWRCHWKLCRFLFHLQPTQQLASLFWWKQGKGRLKRGGGGARYHHTKGMTHYQQPCRQGWSLPVLKLFCAKFQPEV